MEEKGSRVFTSPEPLMRPQTGPCQDLKRSSSGPGVKEFMHQREVICVACLFKLLFLIHDA